METFGEISHSSSGFHTSTSKSTRHMCICSLLSILTVIVLLVHYSILSHPEYSNRDSPVGTFVQARARPFLQSILPTQNGESEYTKAWVLALLPCCWMSSIRVQLSREIHRAIYMWLCRENYFYPLPCTFDHQIYSSFPHTNQFSNSL